MLEFNMQNQAFVGNAGSLSISQDDLVVRRLAMLLEGECELGPKAAAEKFGISRGRYFQLRKQFQQSGTEGLVNQRRGPKRNFRRTDEIVRQVIRHRFLDLEASPEVIAQKLVQCGATISTRSVERIIQDYALQKKIVSTPSAAATDRNPTHNYTCPGRTGRPPKP